MFGHTFGHALVYTRGLPVFRGKRWKKYLVPFAFQCWFPKEIWKDLEFAMQVPSAINLAVFMLLLPLLSSSLLLLLLLHFWTMPRYSAFWPLGTIDSIWMVGWCWVCMWSICTWVVASVAYPNPKPWRSATPRGIPGESSAPRYLGGLGCSGWGGLSDHLFNFRPKELCIAVENSRDVYEILGVACGVPVILDPFDA